MVITQKPECAKFVSKLIKSVCLAILIILCLVSINAGQTPTDQQRTTTLSLDDLIELKTEHIDIKGCINLYFTESQAIINDEQTLRSHVRNDMRKEQCIKDLANIDFNKYTLLGVTIRSGWCRFPLGLEYQTLKDVLNNRYLLAISYQAPNEPCRAVSRYDLWVLVPKLPDGYQVVFKQGPIRSYKDGTKQNN